MIFMRVEGWVMGGVVVRALWRGIHCASRDGLWVGFRSRVVAGNSLRVEGWVMGGVVVRALRRANYCASTDVVSVGLSFAI